MVRSLRIGGCGFQDAGCLLTHEDLSDRTGFGGRECLFKYMLRIFECVPILLKKKG